MKSLRIAVLALFAGAASVSAEETITAPVTDLDREQIANILSGLESLPISSAIPTISSIIPEGLEPALSNLESLGGPVSGIVHQGLMEAISGHPGALGDAYRQCAHYLDQPMSNLSAVDPDYGMRLQQHATESCMRNILGRRPN